MQQYSPIPQLNSNKWIWVTSIVVLIVAILVAYYFIAVRVVEEGEQAVRLIATAIAENTDLGSALYEKSQNPIKDTLPETVAPVSNPLAGLYQNPFGE